MKKIKIRVLKTSNAIILGLIGLLGFSSCGKIGEDPVDEYGTPSAKFIVNGKVTASDSNEGIENIRVIMGGDTTLTDTEGKYQVVDKHGFPMDQKYNIQFQDIDGELNGDFKNSDSVVEFKDPKFTDGDGHWYQGETSKELNIELNKK